MPPPGSARRPEDPDARNLTRRRIAAAVVDLVVVNAILVAVLVAGGHGRPALTTTASLAFAVITLAYYFAGEVASGQTLGKRLLGLQVRRSDGRRADAGRIAVRTLLRLVDNLPWLYALGLVVVLSTERRQRIGDIFADTVVVRR